jgi:cation diffusion facilitator CzcD-associated flavoprotein CzcO
MAVGSDTQTSNGLNGIKASNGVPEESPVSPPVSALLPKNESDIVGANYVHEPKPIRAIFIGAGISGIAFSYKAKQIEKLSYTIYEKNPDVGGVWYESRYPGVSCDVPAHGYSYTWQPNPDWSRFYARGDEIWSWYKKLAGDYGVYDHAKFNHRVIGATWREQEQIWTVEVEDLATGSKFFDSAEILINGGGQLK